MINYLAIRYSQFLIRREIWDLKMRNNLKVPVPVRQETSSIHRDLREIRKYLFLN